MLCTSGSVDDVVLSHKRRGKGDTNRTYEPKVVYGGVALSETKFDTYDDCLAVFRSDWRYRRDRGNRCQGPGWRDRCAGGEGCHGSYRH